MKIVEANIILRKYVLDKAANEEFDRKTAKDTGRTNVGLRLRICSDHLERKVRELIEQRAELTKKNKEKCPNYKIALTKNPYTHDDCSFINFGIPQNFCETCEFYVENIKGIDISIQELRCAAKCFRDEADYDDTWQ